MEEFGTVETVEGLKKQLTEKESEIIMLRERVSELEQQLSNKDKDIQMLQDNIAFLTGKDNNFVDSVDAEIAETKTM